MVVCSMFAETGSPVSTTQCFLELKAQFIFLLFVFVLIKYNQSGANNDNPKTSPLYKRWSAGGPTGAIIEVVKSGKLLGDLKSFPQISLSIPGSRLQNSVALWPPTSPKCLIWLPEMPSQTGMHTPPWIILMQIHCSLLEPITFKLEGFVIKSSQFERILQECQGRSVFCGGCFLLASQQFYFHFNFQSICPPATACGFEFMVLLCVYPWCFLVIDKFKFWSYFIYYPDPGKNPRRKPNYSGSATR